MSKETESAARDDVTRFIAYLRSVEARDDRAALAALRRGVGEGAMRAEFLQRVVPWAPDHREEGVNPYYLVGALFATHPAGGGRGNLGELFRRLDGTESVERRFVALLNSRMEDLPHRLRQSVSLAKAKGAPVDWERLLRDLLAWNREDRQIQERWARSYWASSGRRFEPEPESESK